MSKEDTKKEIKQAQEKVVKDSKKDKKKKNKKNLEDLSWDEEDEKEGLEFHEEKPEIKELESLEQQLSKERISENVKESEYTKELSHQPVDVLYDQAKALATKAEEKGYLSPTEERQMEYITGAIEEKVEGGEYSFTKETARRASLILQLSSESRSLYKGTNSNDKSFYRSG
jgi:hypothetical protein